jgi:hypothetical protein
VSCLEGFRQAGIELALRLGDTSADFTTRKVPFESHALLAIERLNDRLEYAFLGVLTVHGSYSFIIAARAWRARCK